MIGFFFLFYLKRKIILFCYANQKNRSLKFSSYYQFYMERKREKRKEKAKKKEIKKNKLSNYFYFCFIW
jgi:hypothetical protein